MTQLPKHIIWRDVAGYVGLYKVSSGGDMISTYKSNKRSNGKFLKPYLDNKGYFKVMLSLQGRTKQFLVHRLVAIAFLPNPENKRTVNHIDGNPKNNDLSNLEWATDKEQQQHAWRMGLQRRRGKIVDQHSLTGKHLRRWDSARMAGFELGISDASISHHCKTNKPYRGFYWRLKGVPCNAITIKLGSLSTDLLDELDAIGFTVGRNGWKVYWHMLPTPVGDLKCFPRNKDGSLGPPRYLHPLTLAHIFCEEGRSLEYMEAGLIEKEEQL